MQGKILVPTDLSHESNSVFPWATTIAQAFPNKMYLLHVMDPDSVNKPERLEDFPRLTSFMAADRDAHFVPPLKPAVPVAKMYIYNDNIPKVILGAAKAKNVDLICMAVMDAGGRFHWWSAGETVETIVEKAPCSVLCVRGRKLKEEEWQRPKFRHLLLLTELASTGKTPLTKVMPWVDRFGSMLHIFPLGDMASEKSQTALRDLCHTPDVNTNVLMFDKPSKRTDNLLRFIADTPVDLIIMSPLTREKFSNRLFSDIFVRLLRVTDLPILLLR